MIKSIRSRKDRLCYLYTTLKDEADRSDSLQIQNILAGHFVLSAGGHLEDSLKEIIIEYTKIKSDPKVQRFLEIAVKNLNSLSCGKIGNFLTKFDVDLWEKVKDRCTSSDLSSVDSLKSVRDKIAHGQQGSIGILAVKGYFDGICNVVQAISDEMLGEGFST